MLESFRLTRHKYYLSLLVLCAWTGFGLFFGAQDYFRDVYFGKSPSLTGYLIGWIVCGYSWALLTLPVLRLARRFSFKRLSWPLFFVVHIPGAVLFSLAQLGIYDVISHLIFNGRSFGYIESYKFLLANELQTSFLVYFAILAVTFTFDHFFASGASRARSLPSFEQEVSTESGDRRSVADNSNGSHQNGSNGSPLRRISVKESGRIVLLDVNEIDWIKSEGNYVSLHTVKKKYLVRETMNAMEKKLDPIEFVRLRRSTIARIAEIKEFHPMFNGEYEVVLKTGATLSSSRRYRKNLEAILRA